MHFARLEDYNMAITFENGERLRAVVAFLQVVEADDFSPGEMVFPPDTPDGVSRFPYASESEPVRAFFQMLHEQNWVVPFEWSVWVSSEEAKELFSEDGHELSNATAEQLSKMLTTCVRRDRFSEGSLLADFESGLMTRIIRRADALLRDID